MSSKSKKDKDEFKPKTKAAYDGYMLKDKVALKKKREGIIKYIGRVKDLKGIWFGIEITNAQLGKHNGTKDKIEYFKAKSHKGVFVQSKDIKKKLMEPTNSKPKTTSSKVKVPKKHKRTESQPTEIDTKDKLKKRAGAHSKKKSVPVADVCQCIYFYISSDSSSYTHKKNLSICIDQRIEER